MPPEVSQAFACMFMLIMTVVSAVAVTNTREQYNNRHLWKGQPTLCKFWIVIGLLCFLPLFFKAFIIVVL